MTGQEAEEEEKVGGEGRAGGGRGRERAGTRGARSKGGREGEDEDKVR